MLPILNIKKNEFSFASRFIGGTYHVKSLIHAL